MGPDTMRGNERLSYAVLCVCIICGVLATYLMLRIDSIIHGQLYDYGLQFSTDWADPYWIVARMIYVFLALPMILSVVVLALKFARSRKDPERYFDRLKNNASEEKQHAAFGQSELQIGTIFQEDEPLSASFGPESQQSEEVDETPRLQQDNGLLISCPKCSRAFNRPLVMLDFSSGKTRLVNICPYCNHNLGESLEQRKNEPNGGWQLQK